MATASGPGQEAVRYGNRRELPAVCRAPAHTRPPCRMSSHHLRFTSRAKSMGWPSATAAIRGSLCHSAVAAAAVRRRRSGGVQLCPLVALPSWRLSLQLHGKALHSAAEQKSSAAQAGGMIKPRQKYAIALLPLPLHYLAPH